MIWYVISALAFAVLIALLLFTRIRDGRYLKQKASEAMKAELFSELNDERIAREGKQKKFRKALDDASRGK